jgi:hypothetical protein
MLSWAVLNKIQLFFFFIFSSFLVKIYKFLNHFENLHFFFVKSGGVGSFFHFPFFTVSTSSLRKIFGATEHSEQ